MKKILIGMVLALVFLPIFVSATTYYIDQNSIGGSCSDSNPGTITRPWCTIGKANQMLQAGDTVYIRTGIYEENNGGTVIYPSNSGTTGNYITYQNYPGETVTIQGRTAEAAPYTLINIQPSKSYIKIIGLTLTGVSQSQSSLDPIVYIAGHHVIIQNSIVEYGKAVPDSGGVGIHIAKQGANRPTYVQILNNTIRYFGKQLTSTEGGIGECIRVEGSSHIIDGDTTSACGHNGIGDFDSDHVIVRNNNMHGDWFRGIGVGALPRAFDDIHYLIENNVIWDVHGYDPWGEYAYASQFSGRSIIFRKNMIYDTDGIGIAIYTDANFPEVRDCMFYHNVVVNAGRAHYAPSGWGFSFNERDDGSLSNCAIKNNIFYNNYLDGIEYRGYAVSSEHDITHNHWNADGDPGFVDLAGRDFHLQSSSPNVDAGGFLTKVRSSGSGTQLPVENAHYFFDGYGLVEGDLIQLQGQIQTARITNVDYDNNILTLDKSLSWYSGQGVALAYSGSAPDIGAYEYGSSTPPPPVLGDLNNDGKVDIKDLIIVASNFGKTQFDPVADTDSNGIINILDIIFVASRFT